MIKMRIIRNKEKWDDKDENNKKQKEKLDDKINIKTD